MWTRLQGVLNLWQVPVGSQRHARHRSAIFESPVTQTLEISDPLQTSSQRKNHKWLVLEL